MDGTLMVNIAQTAGVAAVIAFQLLFTNRFSKAQIFNSIYERLSTVNSFTFQNHEIIEKLEKSYNPTEEWSAQLNVYVDMVKNFYYEIYYHSRRQMFTRVIDETEWNSWQPACKKFFSKPYVIGYWESNKVLYGYGFNDYIDKIIAEVKEANTLQEAHKSPVKA